MLSGDWVQLVKFVDLSSEAAAALLSELKDQVPQYDVAIVGTQAACTDAEQSLKLQMQVKSFLSHCL